MFVYEHGGDEFCGLFRHSAPSSIGGRRPNLPPYLTDFIACEIARICEAIFSWTPENKAILRYRREGIISVVTSHLVAVLSQSLPIPQR
jgi:hypothetical protein